MYMQNTYKNKIKFNVFFLFIFSHKLSGPILVKCSGECRGANASKERFKRKMKRLREMGKKPNRLDDWRNYSYSCSCQDE